MKAAPAEQEAFVALQRAAARLMDGVAELLKPYGLPPAQYNVLRILRGAHPERLSCRQVAVRMMTREPDLTRLLDRLEKSGLVRRDRQESDRRIVRVGITPAGLELLRQIDAPMLELHRLQFDVFGPKRTATLTRLLRRVVEP
ncbi:MAG: MarR family winged helix-turn-helix transcriptional regulator [Bryobacteraceae bacterium]